MKSKTISKLKQELQLFFNAYIRKRDTEVCGFFDCISCGECKKIDQMQAGHFYAVKGYDSLRFDEDNAHGECNYCNCYNESHLINYAHNLKIKIGAVRFYELRKRAEDYKMNGYKWTRYELTELIEKYKKIGK